MSGDDAVKLALDTADGFLSPVFARGPAQRASPQSLVDSLNQFAGSRDDPPRTRVVLRALGLLDGIHRALLQASRKTSSDGLAPSSTTDYLYEPSSRRTMCRLLDLITLEGIYPDLSPGVGVPIEKRVKPSLPAGVIATKASISGATEGLAPPSKSLETVVTVLNAILDEEQGGLGSILRDRTLVDLVAASGELAFGPREEVTSERAEHQKVFKTMIDQLSTTDLLSSLTPLLHPATPTWLRSRLSEPLSLAPLRPNGVRQIIDYVATHTQIRSGLPIMEEDSSQIARPKHHQGPDVSLEALTHIARLLASVPSSLTSEIYFEQLAPQMFSLLDGEAGPEMTKVAGYVIGSGILGRKATGAPGTAGWRSYVTPILSSIDPTMHVRTHPPMQGSLLVRHDDLQLALCRLCTLLSSHPNPNLTKRLLGPLLLPLWAISSSMDVSDPRSSSNLSKSLLHMYLRIAADVRKFTMLASHLLYNGKLATSEDIGWRYRAIGSDGVEIRVVPKGERSMNDLVQDLADVDGRVAFFNQLIKTDVVEKDQRGALFLAITRRWLGTTQTAHAEDSNMHVAGLLSGPVPKAIDDPLQSATYAKLTQTMLVDMQENLQENTIQMLEFVRQLLQSFVEGRRQRQLDADRLKNPSLTAIGSIVRHPEAHLSSGEGGRSGEVTTTDSVELLSMALSLLSAVLSSKELHVSREEEGILECLEPSLTYVSRVSDLPASTKATASSLLGLIDLMSSSLIPKSSTTTVSPSLVEDRKTQSLALTYLADNLPPVRAEGLSLLSSLIRSSSPIIDVSATATLLISILQDADEFIHLNAIKVLVYLADKHSRTVTKLLLEQYVDSREALTLDQRLRLGEALQQTAQRLGEAFAGDAAKVVGEGCLQLAGRRGRKPKTAQVKAKRRELDEQRKQEAAEAWGGEVPQVGDEAPQDEEGEEKEILAKILEGWEGSDAEEDVRIRASAVSVFGAAMEANIAGLGSTLSSTGIDLAMSILTLEKSDDKAILRRAAILLILSLVHSLDQAREQQKKLGFGLAGENLQDVVTVLRYVHATDGDTLVQQHAGTAIEELEAWQAKHLLGVSSSEREEAISQTEVIGDRIVGLPMLLRPGGDGPSKIEEIE